MANVCPWRRDTPFRRDFVLKELRSKPASEWPGGQEEKDYMIGCMERYYQMVIAKEIDGYLDGTS